MGTRPCLQYSAYAKLSTHHLYRCHLLDVMVEMGRMLRPEGTVMIHDSPKVINVAVNISRAVMWTAIVHDQESESHANEQILVATLQAIICISMTVWPPLFVE